MSLKSRKRTKLRCYFLVIALALILFIIVPFSLLSLMDDGYGYSKMEAPVILTIHEKNKLLKHRQRRAKSLITDQNDDMKYRRGNNSDDSSVHRHSIMNISNRSHKMSNPLDFHIFVNEAVAEEHHHPRQNNGHANKRPRTIQPQPPPPQTPQTTGEHFGLDFDFDANPIYKQYRMSARNVNDMNNYEMQERGGRHSDIVNNRSLDHRLRPSANNTQNDDGNNANEMIETDMDGHRVIYARNAVIYGNPLLLPKCRNALFHKNPNLIRILARTLMENRQHQNNNASMEWIWTKESIDEWIQNTSSLNNRKQKITVLGRKGHGRSTIYAHIMKSASSSISQSLKLIPNGTFHTIRQPLNVRTRTKCGFTFVRNPLSRLISAYYTINRLLYGWIMKYGRLPHYFLPQAYESLMANKSWDANAQAQAHAHRLNFWYIRHEPWRFRSFVRDVLNASNSRVLIKQYPLYHMETQTRLLSTAKMDLHFVFKFEHMSDLHFSLISKYCSDDVDSNPQHMRLQSRMRAYGMVDGTKYVNDSFLEMLNMSRGITIAEADSMVKPAYYAIDRDLYDLIVDYYYQDYVCFNYTPSYQKEVLDVISNSNRGNGGVTPVV